MGRRRTRTSRTAIGTGTRTSEDHDFREFLDEDQDGDEDVRGRQFSEISGTSEDEDGEDVDILRRPGCILNIFKKWTPCLERI